ncbi:hypothetical protein AB0B25_17540 [Nocardia sp. NPDC049190]|uniref:hypothetical protein n=1 Tax=Nocardia sp. NPDC049190 TaxID=3155650 RepID=UPI0033FC07FB
MAFGTFSYQNGSGYSDRIDNPEDYRTFNIEIGKGAVDNQTNATVRLYTGPDGRGDSHYVNPHSSAYLSTSYQSCMFST